MGHRRSLFSTHDNSSKLSDISLEWCIITANPECRLTILTNMIVTTSYRPNGYYSD